MAFFLPDALSTGKKTPSHNRLVCVANTGLGSAHLPRPGWFYRSHLTNRNPPTSRTTNAMLAISKYFSIRSFTAGPKT